MSDTPEFSRLRRLDTIGQGDARESITATAAERAALAMRFGLLSVEALSADYTLHREAAGIVATGHVSARVTQACVATDEPVAESIEEDFAIRFVAGVATAGGEIDLDADALDTMFFDGGAVDLGEAAAETMALALDPFPRSPDAEAVLKAAGVKAEEELAAEAPKGALAGLKDLLGKG